MPKVSVIVPVYNVEKYVKKCILSILNQTYSNLEIIVVNDGSTDSSLEIIKELSIKDSRIKIYSKENGGLSSARNYGLKYSSGRYVGFIDIDDYIESNMFETLYYNLVSNSCDMAACGYQMVYENGKKININDGNKLQVYDRNESFKKMFKQNNLGMIFCNKLFKKELFDNIFFPEGKYFEDINTMYKIVNKIEKCVYAPDIKYYYLQRGSSINGKSFKEKKFNNKIYDLYDATMEVYKFIKEKYQLLLYDASISSINYLLRVNNKLIKHNVKNKDVVNNTKNIINSNFKKIIKDKEIGFKRKIQYLLFAKFNFIYRILIKLFF